MANTEAGFLPKWALEIRRFFPVKSQFILCGNIFDVYPFESNGAVNLIEYVKLLLKEQNFGLIVLYEPLFGFSILYGEEKKYKEITGSAPGQVSLKKCAENIEALTACSEMPAAVILKFASRLNDIAKGDFDEFLFRMFRLSHSYPQYYDNIIGRAQYNPVFWLMDKENDLPPWFSIANHNIKTLHLPKPDYAARREIISIFAKRLNGYSEMRKEKIEENERLFINQTSGLYANEIISISSLALREKISFSNIAEAIKAYKLGITENPWGKIEKVILNSAEEKLCERVKGQPNAVRASTDTIKRAAFNLSGSQYSKYSHKPKGVLFFAGPTGVGKTELAKSITELIFGSDSNYIRFDMSEFSHEHADQRLIGAPPGYVGFDAGGEITNAVKQNPFSVILFDEIEKAHPKIMDIFLQILDDGRLTSGRGETVYFSEALIIFTSNLGIYEINENNQKIQRVRQDMPYDEISGKIRESIDDYFKYKLNRPEILNRIGENIIVFDFIRKETGVKIFKKMLFSTLAKLSDNFNISIELHQDMIKALAEICCSDLSMGGRGIGNKIERCFINPLSRALLEINAEAGGKYQASNFELKDNEWIITLQK
ncbi:MAG TPA: AAA family ATPase [bacterium]|nr:AAA family ATPase [bacterium]HPN30301.1 AAA family ATPase [bacterium]